MDNSHPLVANYQIDGKSNSIESDLPASQSISIPDDDQKGGFDPKPDSTDGIILSPNPNGESPAVKKDTEYWQSITNYLSQGLLLVAITTEIIGLLHYVRNSEIRKCFEYKDCFQSGIEILSTLELAFVAVLLIIIISYAAVSDGPTKMDQGDLKIWTYLVGFFTFISLFFCLFAIGIDIGDEGNHYLFWNKQHLVIDDLNQTSLIFSYDVKRSISDESNRYAVPPSEFYDIVAKMIRRHQMNSTETQTFLQKYNCDDVLSFPISFDPLLTPIRSLLGSFVSICE